MWQSNWKVQASALIFAKGNVLLAKGSWNTKFVFPALLGEKSEARATKSRNSQLTRQLKDSGRRLVDFHLSHLMFPPSYGWKELFNLRCVFLGWPWKVDVDVYDTKFPFYWTCQPFNDASRVKDVHTDEVMYQQFEVYTWCWDIFRWYRWFLPEKTLHVPQAMVTSVTWHYDTFKHFQNIGNFHGEMSLNLNVIRMIMLYLTSPPLGTCELILVENHEVVRPIIFNHSHS